MVRTKEHPAKPMSVDDALYEMELVGHDFFLFYDKQTERPSVVYRRHAYDYGLIGWPDPDRPDPGAELAGVPTLAGSAGVVT